MQLKLEVTAALLIAPPSKSLVKMYNLLLEWSTGAMCSHTHRFPHAPNHFYYLLLFSPWRTPEWLDPLNHTKPYYFAVACRRNHDFKGDT